MKTYFDCIPCFCRQTLDALRMVTDDSAIQERVLREVLRLASTMDLAQSPPEMGWKIHRLIREATGNPDPYAAVKRRFNQLALEFYPKLLEQVQQSENSFETAVRLAIAGNVIDFGVNPGLEEGEMQQSVLDALKAPLDERALYDLQSSIENAMDILYLGDNTGEIVFDRLLIEQMPEEKVTFVVRGSPVINDATMEDAEMTGITKLVSVIDNGSDAPATILESCSSEFRRRFEQADLIIAKGQGNYETLSDVKKNIFFLLKIKCPVIAEEIGSEVGSFVVKRPVSTHGEAE